MGTDIIPAASLPEKMTYAQALAESGLLPAQYRKQPANVLYALEYGATIGIGTMAAITGVHVIEGKPSASAGLISALVRRAGHKLRQRIEHDEQGRPIGICEIVRCDDPDYTYRSVWTLERAARAKLTGKDVWQKYPEAMLKARAITECARDACEEVLFGLHYTPEELGAEVAEDGTVVITDAPQRPTPPQPSTVPPPTPPVEPTGDEPITKEMLHVLAGQFTTLGVADRDEGLMTIALLTDIKVDSTKALTVAQARKLIDVLDPLTKADDPSAALTEAIETAIEAMRAEQEGDVLDGQIVTNHEEHDAAA